jgi:hypothetical protein
MTDSELQTTIILLNGLLTAPGSIGAAAAELLARCHRERKIRAQQTDDVVESRR